jgi:hypothetical protein
MPVRLALALGFTALLFGAPIRAQQAAAAEPQTTAAEPTAVPSAAEQQPPSSAPKRGKPTRPLADSARGYVRPPRGSGIAKVALFLPRLVLAVPRYTLRLVFFPVEKLFEVVDENHVVAHVRDVLYNDEGTAGIVPKIAVDSFFGASIGARAFHENLAGHGEYGSAEARFGGLYDSFSQLTFRADRFGGSRLWLESSTRYESRPGLLFEGIGHPGVHSGGTNVDPRAAAIVTRFHERRYLALLRSGYSFGRPGSQFQLGATGSYNLRDFGPKTAGSDPSTDAVYDTSKLVGFDDRVPVFELDANAVLDTRDAAGATSSGSYVEAFAGRAPRAAGYEFWHHGVEATTYLNLYHHNRILILRAALEGVEGHRDEIPFSELPRLGGPNRLRGYALDRFRDKKALLATVEYHYPIHQFVSGSLYVDVGRVERSYSDFVAESGWKAGGGGGFVFRSRRKLELTIDIAYGDGVQFYVTTDPLRAFAKKDTEL